jgi:ABC-2 type transport system ATP-binding protein
MAGRRASLVPVTRKTTRQRDDLPRLLSIASGGLVALRTAAHAQAMMVLAQAGATVATTGRDTFTISVLPAERIVAVLGASSVPFSEMSAHRATLEEAYMEPTRDAVEYHAEPARKAKK